MDSEVNSSRGTGTVRDTGAGSGEAAKPSPGSIASSSGTVGCGRVLRERPARGAVALERVNRTILSKDDVRQQKPECLRRRRGRTTSSYSKNTDATGTVKKSHTAKKASLCTPRPKVSKSTKGQQRSSTRIPRSAPVCKTEPETEGVEKGTLKGNDKKLTSERAVRVKMARGHIGEIQPYMFEPQSDPDSDEESVSECVTDDDAYLDDEDPLRDDPNDLNYKPEATKEKSWRREDKTEESEKNNEVKVEELPKMDVKTEDELGDDIEAPRKRGRRRKDDKTPRLPKRRKKPPVQYVRCEIEGCGTVLAHPRYLQHHIKYQHLLKKKYVCDHPSCGRLFRLQKQLLRHAKHHTDQRDYICEFCARAFKSSHNLAVHRMIHTGEKPIQCEICGFTCRQKASLNWHMKKHAADAFYHFSCSICGKKFEKKDCVVAHKAKSHPEVLIAEALAANGGTLTNTPAPVLETVPRVSLATQAHVSQGNQEAPSETLTPLQQVVLPLDPQTHTDVSQGRLLQLGPHEVLQAKQEQETTTLLHLTASTTASAAHLSSTNQPQLIQLTALPTTTASPMTAVDPHTTLLTLSSVTTLSPVGTLAAHQAVEWVRETDGGVLPAGEGVLWQRVVVGGGQDVGEMVWEGDGGRGKEDGGMVWERDGEQQMLVEGAEGHADSLI
ncbi:uncharacterized protein ACJ7VT_012249 [Polymixia lowei]